MPEKKFVVGDVVQVRSSTVKMTVFLVHPSTITCMWFNSAGHCLRESFPPEVLEHVERFTN